jgi:hypothetical protein
MKKDVFRQHRVVVQAHVCMESLLLTLDAIRFLLLARRNAGIQRYLHGWAPAVLVQYG